MTVCILTIGIVLVLRSFLSVSTALGRSSNIVSALRYLEEKMVEIEETAIRNEGIEEASEQGDFVVGGRTFRWHLEVETLAQEEYNNLSEVSLDVSWKEGHKEDSLSLSTYIKTKEPE